MRTTSAVLLLIAGRAAAFSRLTLRVDIITHVTVTTTLTDVQLSA